MKELLLHTLKTMFPIPLEDVKEFFSGSLTRLILAAHLWCITLGVYLIMIIMMILICFLFGKWDNFLKGILDFTRAYFYDGTFFYFLAWKLHLVFFCGCFLASNE